MNCCIICKPYLSFIYGTKFLPENKCKNVKILKTIKIVLIEFSTIKCLSSDKICFSFSCKLSGPPTKGPGACPPSLFFDTIELFTIF